MNEYNELMNNKEYDADITAKAEVKNNITPDFLKTIISSHNSILVDTTAKSYDPVNIAHCLEEVSSEDLLFFYKSVNSDTSAKIFSYLTYQTKENVIKAFSDNELTKLVDNMKSDDLVDFVDELPANLMNRVLQSVPKNERERVKTILNLKDDTAGALMTVEYLSIRNNKTVKECKDKIKEEGKKCDTIWKIFIVDETRKLVGTINLDKLIESDDSLILDDIMTNDYVSVFINTDQEVVLQAFRKYDTSVIPVVKSDNRMVGIITFDDVMDVQSEENSEDAMLQSGVIPTDKPYLKSSIFTLVKNYSIWLIILLVLNTFTSMVLSRLQNMGPLLAVPVLIAILPLLMGTNGNASDQTCTVIIRELSLGNISTHDYFKVMFKEFRVSLITSSFVSAFSFIWILIELYTGIVSLSSQDMLIINNSFFNGNKNLFFVLIALSVAITFFISVVISKLLAVSLPIFAKKIRLDPAIMSQPILSTIMDIVTIVIYFLICLLIIKI